MAKYKFDDPEKAYAEALRLIKQADEDGATALILSQLGLTSVPPEIGQLTKLTMLFLQINKLTSVPPEIRQLVKLTGLFLPDNQLTSVPPEIWQLEELDKLELYDNQLTSVPSKIGNLAKLADLVLNRNQLTSVPPEIGQLAKLKSLRLSSNQLTSVPPEIGQLDKRIVLDLAGNPLNDGMQAAYDRGLDEFLAYLRSLQRDAEPLYEAKLVLVGEGAVGKTSLLDALQGRDFVAERATTHGIEIATEPLDLPHPEIAETDIRLNCWDFGGQPVYRVTHQFFFSRRSLYLLLWSPRMSPDQCDVEGWIKRIKLRVGEGARIIVVATHAKTGDRIPRINESALRRDHRSVVVDFCEIDSKTGYGIDELKTLIAETAAQLPQMGNAFSASWKAARDEVIELADTQPRLSYSRFTEICEPHGLDEIAIKTLADFMDILGYVVYFADDQNLKEEMILQPQWLAKAIGYVLEDPDTNASRGELQHAWLHDIWYEHGKAGFERYDPELHPYFLRLMEKFNVSYRLEGGESSLVAELVPKDRPELPWLPDQYHGEEGQLWLSLVCQMNESPPGLVSWLIVGAHRFATEPRRHWQEGMYLAYEPHGSAVVELRDRELQIDVRAEFPSHFMSVLSDHLTYLIRRSWRGLDYDLAVPCPQIVDPGERCEGRFELDALREFKAEGDETIRCQKCRQRQQIDKMLFGFDTPGLLAGSQGVTIEGDMSGSTIILGNQNTASTMQRIEQDQTSSPSEAADLLRVVLRAMNAETRECPRLFTLIPRQLANWNPRNLSRDGLRMTLWCEMPDCEHATCKIGSDGPGEYTFTRPQEWLVKVAPYAKMISTLLSVAAPVAAASVKAAIGPDTLVDVGKSIDVMKEVVSGSLKLGGELAGEIDEKGGPRDADGYRSAEGAGLRELHSLLLELDPAKTWGNLRRVLTPTGDYLWLCPTHYREYDPGLPVLPTSSGEKAE